MNPFAGIDPWTVFKIFARLVFDFVLCVYGGVIVGTLIATAALVVKRAYCWVTGKKY